MSDGTVVLLSGGIDSLVCAEVARLEGALRGCVFVDYGHPALVQETWKAFAYCGSRGVRLVTRHALDLWLGDMGTGTGARVVPARNAVLLALAANAAAEMGASSLTIGCNAADQRDYPDCRPGFIGPLSQALGLEIRTPLIEMSKPEIVAKAASLGLSRSDAWACYLGGPSACGTCPSCVEAAAGWGG